MIGETFNHYRIVAQLGKGGMGEVYAAEDLKLGRRVALKILPEPLAANPDRRMRFEREAKAIAALNHPNIVTIYSVEEANGIHFLTMEMVKGATLSELIPKAGLSLERLLAFAVPLADAVGAAHRKGIVHRDLKPDNVVVGEEGRVKVLDFGLAKLETESGDPATGTQLPTEAETQEGRILGTVAYMSPEQAEGRPVDARSDIFSLGVLLYQMASGQRPFQGDTAISTISSILKDTPTSILELNKALPRHLGRIVSRCLAKDPDRRYQTAIDLRNDLDGLAEEVRSGEVIAEAPAMTPVRRRRPGWLAATAVVLAALALGYAVSRLTAQRRAAASPAFEEMKITRLTTAGDISDAAISPDGRYVAFVQRGGEGESLWLRQVSVPSSVQILPATGDRIWDPAFSREGDAIYFIRRVAEATGWSPPTLYRVPVLGGTPMKVLENVWERISFSPDGSRFAFSSRMGETSLIMTAARDGGDLRTIGEREPPEEFPEEGSWSPDGSMVAVAAVRWTGRMEHRLVGLPAGGGGPEQPISRRTWGEIGEAAWLPDGSGIVMTAREGMAGSNQIWEVSYPDGAARRITNDLNEYSGVSLTSDGSTLVTVQFEGRAELWIAPGGGAGGQARELPARTLWAGLSLSWTPDGRIVHGVNVSGSTDIWITGEGGGSSQLTIDPAEDYDPVVCEGRYIVFVSSRAGSHNLWRMDFDGGNKVQLTSGEGEFLPLCRPGTGRVVFQRQGPSRLQIAAVPIDGGETTPLSPEMGLGWWTMDLSPDGNGVAYLVPVEAGRRWVLEILNLSDEKTARPIDLAVGHAAQMRWSPDGRSIQHVVTEKGVDNIWSTPLDGGPSRQLTRFDGGRIRAFAWLPDGTKMVLAKGTVSSDIVLLRGFR